MASATSIPLSPPHLRQSIFSTSLSQCATLPLHQSRRFSKTSVCSRKIARNVAAMATTEVETTSIEIETTTELPDFVNTLQDTWDKVEDKYAVSSLAFASVLGLIASTGVISAIDKLPLVPGVLELVGIGYTGWFAYKNLIFKPEREELIQKIKDTYGDIIGTN